MSKRARERARPLRPLPVSVGPGNWQTASPSVRCKEAANGQTDVYTILGAWDGDAEKGILSYQSAFAQAIIGHKVGEQVSVPTEHGERVVEIVSIEAYKK